MDTSFSCGRLQNKNPSLAAMPSLLMYDCEH